MPGGDVGINKHIRKRLEGLERQIQAHQEKIRAELEKSQPDWGLIGKWEREIRVWERERRRLIRRLRGS
ncbi:hypothetical protein [Thermus caldilimi]|uniref:hypothetical protein n=1 Tax=Thermus caldilimi TaxID=2483360 RepID=UPI001F0EB5EE|nr:hypothetical protein [Thermus caldilimi]